MQLEVIGTVHVALLLLTVYCVCISVFVFSSFVFVFCLLPFKDFSLSLFSCLVFRLVNFILSFVCFVCISMF